ncbi:malonyl-CoA decarboxylase [Paracoccus sp. MBLB3053]|uniref:Malonyl-CoA decarboxylase n=1 Tax=Paracoccus aurantius TaxID=3073814 RepID=A0ABU2HVC3_9RHOB|nr:malonyl-CoA decarboxylase [Paracoccus sp. MBLB3053]MDS9468997.1 malonyl-CoA decarboxylase [Paracoccus sp. MBLB3053]
MAFFSDLMATLFERRPASPPGPSKRPISELCEALLSSQGEISGVRLARDILSHYRAMSLDERVSFFQHLAQDLDLDPVAVAEAAAKYGTTRSPEDLYRLCREAEPRRQELLRRLNQAPGATEELVRMRLDLLRLVPDTPRLRVIDADFQHLFASWFNRGFLVLRHIDWRTPANILEKIIEYEAVHAINDWHDLQRRLRPSDRRCFAFFHPAMPEEPLIFVEVALCKGVPGSVQALLAEERETESAFDTAVFYSISNCQEGLRGISFGNSLIKQVVEELKRDLPQVSRFVTLSPVPGLARWLKELAPQRPEAEALLRAEEPAAIKALADDLRKLTAEYLLKAKRSDGLPVDPVARFHLGNGALLHEIHALADISPNGLRQSRTAMVNYLYDLEKVEQNNESFVTERKVAASKQAHALLMQGQTTGRKQ